MIGNKLQNYCMSAKHKNFRCEKVVKTDVSPPPRQECQCHDLTLLWHSVTTVSNFWHWHWPFIVAIEVFLRYITF